MSMDSTEERYEKAQLRINPSSGVKKKPLHCNYAVLPCFMASTLMLTALLWASNPSTVASCMTALDRRSRPSAVRLEVVMCFRNEPRLTPEYCFA